MYFHFEWTDSQRVWTAKSNLSIPKVLKMQKTEIWYPKFRIEGCLSESCLIEPEEDRVINLREDGRASFGTWKTTVSQCEQTFTNFPRDSAKCTINFYSTDPISLNETGIEREKRVSSSEWFFGKQLVSSQREYREMDGAGEGEGEGEGWGRGSGIRRSRSR